MSYPTTARATVPSLALALVASLSCSSPQTIKALPQIELSATSVDFGDVPVLNTASQTLQINNSGRAPLTVTSVAVVEDGTPFAVVSAPQTVEPGGAADVTISFVPPALAPYAATLAVQSDDADNPLLTVALTGTGLTSATMVADASLDFGVVCEGTETIQSAKVRSTGTADLIVEDVHFTPDTAPEFQFVSSTKTPATVAQGATLALAVRVSPTTKSPDLLTGAIVVGGTDPANRTASIPLSAKVNRAPKAVVAPPANAAPGATVTLDGSGSTDPDGNLPLTFAWALKTSPIGSSSQPKPLDQPQTSLVLDLPGQYTLALTVKDSLGCASQPVFQDVLAKPAEQLVVELVWDNLSADLDLHMVPDGSDFFGPKDCYYATGHTSPDWGNPAGGPTLERDALTGYGPEIIGYGQPLAGLYHVMAYYYSSHGSKTPQTVATVRVYEFGIIKAELSQTLYLAGQQWKALDIDWPSGTITTVDEVK